MTETAICNLIREHAAELQRKYNGLILTDCSPNGGVVQGILRFTASYEGIEDVIDGEYQVDIHIPELYPDRLPMAKERGGKIEKSFHTNPDGTLCLGAPLAVKKAFSECPNLVGFVEKCLIPFFFSYEYKKKYGFLPYGELSHGAEGILEHYQELFRTDDDLATLGLLRLLADNDYRGHYSCPCGKLMRLRQCHGEQIRELLQYQSQNEFLNDYAQVMLAINLKKVQIPKAVFSKAMTKYLKVAELVRKGIIR
ncbi:MAG: hypothetical protein M0024_04050 [Nitrospiraceae bacterium]|nr:hypothetical protein [Nitrospiraceae bacterium]